MDIPVLFIIHSFTHYHHIEIITSKSSCRNDVDVDNDGTVVDIECSPSVPCPNINFNKMAIDPPAGEGAGYVCVNVISESGLPGKQRPLHYCVFCCLPGSWEKKERESHEKRRSAMQHNRTCLSEQRDR